MKSQYLSPGSLWSGAPIRVKIIFAGVLSILIVVLSILMTVVPAVERSIVEQKKEMIRSLVGTAHQTLEHYHYLSEVGQLPDYEAKNRALYNVNKFRFGEDLQNTFWVVSLDGNALAFHSREDLVGKNIGEFTDPDGRKVYAEMSDLCRKQKEGFIQYSQQYKFDSQLIVPILSYVKLFEPWDLYVGAGVYLDDVAGETRSMVIRISLLATVMAAFASVFLFMISGAITRPVRELIQSMKESDLNTVVAASTGDEIGVLAGEFNSFIQKIKSLVIEVRDMADQLTIASSELSAIAVDYSKGLHSQNEHALSMIDNVNGITEEMNSITVNTDSEFQSLNELVQKMRVLSDMIIDLNSSARKGTEIIGSISNLAESGRGKLDVMLDSIKKIGKQSGEISGIINIINDISEQINLLSLNASIEAARAGEFGRGFAVVASQISKLADETAVSIKDIGRIIRENEHEISEGSSRVSETAESFAFIIEGIGSIRDFIAVVMRNMENQLGTKETVEHEINIISDLSESIMMTTKVQKMSVSEINDSIGKIVGKINDLASSSEELAASSEFVLGMTETLKEKVAMFKL